MAVGSIVLWFIYSFLSFRKRKAKVVIQQQQQQKNECRYKLSLYRCLTVGKITPTVMKFSGKVDNGTRNR